MSDRAKVIATWDISLDCECPSCGEYVDLLKYEDFWDGRRIQPIENSTPATDNLNVVCPNCGHYFDVCCEY